MTLDGSTVPVLGFSRGTSGAATLLWRLDLGSPATLVAVALSSTAWSTAVSAETAALQQAFGLLCAPTTLSSVQPLMEGIFSVADVDPWHSLPMWSALLAAPRSFESARAMLLALGALPASAGKVTAACDDSSLFEYLQRE